MSRSVFISYATDDTTIAEQIRDGLEAGDGNVAGIPCWMAPRDIGPGKEYGIQILDAIEACSVMVLILSASSNESRFVRNEVERAVSKDKVVIPVRIQDVPISRGLEFFISNAQWINAISGVEAAIRKLLAGIRPYTDGQADYGEEYDEGPAGTVEAKGQRPRHNLPASITPFIGRQDEMGALHDLIVDPSLRLITVVGPGGMGKTRLALETGRQWAQEPGHFVDGIYFVTLAPLSATEQIVPAMADALGFQLETGQYARGPEEQLRDHLAAKNLLLILDNFEHLVSGAGLVTRLLVAAPGLHVLATSRERLHLQNEQVFSIQGLEFPAWETPEDAAKYTAVQLFIQSARRVDPGFRLQAGDLTYLTRICRLVSGMPLGIELAAGWVDMLPLAEIVDEIEASLDFLETQTQDVPDRHRSVRAVFDYSWQQLIESEQEVLARISVFRGGFHREAAREIAGASIRTLASLAAKSLLQINAERNRYEVHELVRQFAEKNLSKMPEYATATRDAHSAYFCAYMQEQEVRLKGSEQLAALLDIEREHENVRAGWAWALESNQLGRLAQALESLCLFYDWRGRYEEAERLCGETMEIVDGRKHVRLVARMIAWQTVFSRWSGQKEDLSSLLDQGLALLKQSGLSDGETAGERAALLRSKGDWVWLFGGNADEAIRHFEQSLELYRALADSWAIARLCLRLNIALRNTGTPGPDEDRRLAAAQEYALESLDLSRADNNEVGIAEATYSLGFVLAKIGRLDAATPYLEESLDAFAALNLPRGEIETLSALGLIHWQIGSEQLARELVQRAAEKARAIGYTARQCIVLWTLGWMALEAQDYAEADRSLAESVAIGRRTGIDNELAMALALSGWADYAQGRRRQMLRHLAEALAIGIRIRRWQSVDSCLLTICQLLLDRNEPERAVELCALIESSERAKRDTAFLRTNAAATAALSGDVVAAARARGKQLDAWQTAEAYLQEIRAWRDES